MKKKKKIRVMYRAAENQYSDKYQWVEAYTDLLVDEDVAMNVTMPHIICRPGDSNMASLELLLEQLETLRKRAYLPGSIFKIQYIEG